MTLSYTENTGIRWAVDQIVDERFGIIRDVIEVLHERGEPQAFQFVADLGPTQNWLPRKPFGHGGGASLSRDTAIAKAIGECIERYCAAIYDLDDLNLASADELAPESVDPADFALFSAEQYASPGFPFKPFTSWTPVRWREGHCLNTGGRVCVPAASVFLPYYGERFDEDIVIPPVSTGLAAGSSATTAALSATLEVVERDAFCQAWYNMASPRRLAPEGAPANVEALLNRFSESCYDAMLFDITTDLDVPTVLAIALDERTDAPAMSVATSSSLRVELAAQKALEELLMTVRYQRDLYHERQKDGYGLAGDWHLTHWNRREHREDAAFLWSSGEVVSFEELAGPSVRTSSRSALNEVMRRLEKKGHNIYLCDITTSDVGELGLHVVRAIVPGLQPLLFGPGMVAEGGSRLRSPLVNTMPHPFP